MSAALALSFGSAPDGPCAHCDDVGVMFGLYWHRDGVTVREERVCRGCLDKAIGGLPVVAAPPSVLPFVDALLDLDAGTAERAIDLYRSRR